MNEDKKHPCMYCSGGTYFLEMYDFIEAISTGDVDSGDVMFKANHLLDACEFTKDINVKRELNVSAIQKNANFLYEYLKELVHAVEIISSCDDLVIKPEFVGRIKDLLASIDGNY